MVENVAPALYGVCVSWPYMAMVHRMKKNPINLLSLTDLHRKIPGFCSHIAANPKILLDPTTPIEELTIDGKPFLDNFLIDTIQQLALNLSNLLLTISAMFSGAADGWVHFTPEFHVDSGLYHQHCEHGYRDLRRRVLNILLVRTPLVQIPSAP
jgi:hypothetical protein